MAPTPKPSAFGSSIPHVNKDHLQELKPRPPMQLHYMSGVRLSKDFGNTNNEPNTASSDHHHDFVLIERPKEDTTHPDFGFRDVLNVVKSLDVNRYATKKTIAQGMLDIALLTANASQLKYILQVGKQHEFYTLMLTLICTSIALQVLQGIICVLLGSTFNINKTQDQPKANVWNNISLTMMVLTVAVNIIISAFDMRDTDSPETQTTTTIYPTLPTGIR